MAQKLTVRNNESELKLAVRKRGNHRNSHPSTWLFSESNDRVLSNIRRYSLLAIILVLLHGGIIWMAAREWRAVVHRYAAAPLSLLPIARKTEKVTLVSEASIVSLMIDQVSPQPPGQLNIEYDTSADLNVVGSGQLTPPQPIDLTANTHSLVLPARIEGKANAIVVLRVEVGGDGQVKRVVVDVSGGEMQIDNAAIAYVRSLQWRGGRVDGRPATIWIRWGVTLIE